MAASVSSAAISNVALGNEVSLRVAGLALDAARQEGDAAILLIESAADAAPRGAISARPTAGETGGRIDVTG
ncbi:MAG: hypothetical protein AAGI17_06890 [Planctomycetota bacterium]